MTALAKHRPAVATVLDWEHEEQLPEVLGWAEEAAQNVSEAVVLIPKVPGGVHLLPRQINSRRVVLGYSVPTSYGASPLGLWEFAGWPVHLLGGQPHKQMLCYSYLRGIAEVVSADGNAACQQCHKGRFWSARKSPVVRSHWWQLREAGDERTQDVNLECLRRSLVGIREAWISNTSLTPPLPADTNP